MASNTTLTLTDSCPSNVAPLSTAQTELSWRSAITMLVFLCINVCVIHPLTFRLPRGKRVFQLDFGNSPVIGLLVLLVTTCISFDEVKIGFIGDERMQPYSIFILFFALAYICVSLDLTGVFRFVALKVAFLSGTSGPRLFFYFYVFNSVLTIFTSNDVVILTITPILIYFCKERGIPPAPFLMSQFVAANCWSLALYIGNPTNIIVADAYQLSFFRYSYWMFLPATVAGLTSLLMSWILFRKDIPTKLEPITLRSEDIKKELTQPTSAIFGIGVLLTCLVTLIATSFSGIPVWIATLPFCGIMFMKDILVDVYNGMRHRRNHKMELLQMESFGDGDGGTPSTNSSSEAILLPGGVRVDGFDEDPLGRGDSEEVVVVDMSKQMEKQVTANRKNSWWETKFPLVSGASARMPWRIGPFIISMFILVEALNSTGWLALFATGFQRMIAGRGVLASVFAVGYLSSLGCVLLNNQPMTILFTKMLLHPNFACAVTALELKSSMFALVMGSNFGANFALNGALAGLMWVKILVDKDVKDITFTRFMMWGTITSVPIVALALLALSAELLSFSQD